MTSHRVLSISVCLLAAATAVRAQEGMTNLTLADATARACTSRRCSASAS